jgi:acyl-CoA dehydrogenase
MNVLEELLSGVPPPRANAADVATFWKHLGTCSHARGIERALWGGFVADRLGFAFVAGYSAAMDRLLDLVPLPSRGLTCLCATESGGAHPRAIATRLRPNEEGYVVDGEKIFATLATTADDMLVFVTEGQGDDGKSRLRLVRVATAARGVTLTERSDVPFAPEVSHARVRFEHVSVAEKDVLPGDGYTRYVKPFRTVEDVHVLASTIGYLLGVARVHAWDPELSTELVAIATTLDRLADRDPSDAVTHVALAGLFRTTKRLIDESGPRWDHVADEERARWTRDSPLLLVAEKARAKRTERAFHALAER